MAVSPPGDIVLDVLRAADPASVKEARMALTSGTPPAAETARAAESFDQAFGAAMRLDARTEPGRDGEAAELRDSYREFEAMVLQQFMQSMLPEDTAEFFGEGTAGEIWKSMMAEQLGRALADSGGIGLAEQMMEGARDRGLLQENGEAAKLDLGGASTARVMLQELERSAVESWGEGDDADQGSLWSAG